MERIIGFDIGSLYLKVIILDSNNREVFSDYIAHYGEPARALKQVLTEKFLITSDVAIGVTGIASEAIAASLGLKKSDEITSAVSFARAFDNSIRNIIDIGGGSLTLIRLDEHGKLANFSTNSLCAAGTGSFLDEQAERLGIDYATLSQFPFIETPPAIATRCAVFAKSDLIHHQQEGRTKAEMWSGLCKGMAGTLVSTLLRGRPLNGRTLVIGGVARNPEVIRWLKESVSAEIIVPSAPHLASGAGAALLAREQKKIGSRALYSAIERLQNEKKEKSESKRAPLLLKKSNYPSFKLLDEYTDKENNEVRTTVAPTRGSRAAVAIGVDIGSTSTKAAVVDVKTGEVIVDIYRRTQGDPVGASKKLFFALSEWCKRYDVSLDVKACGTTGSGRKLVGMIIGADAIVNEITAHVTGAKRVDPTIETIFEIGGQDAKYMSLKNGAIHDANMNYVCAAGTGSFVEEQARKLGISVFEISDMVEGIAPPVTSDRCTVFMEQDVRRLIKEGYSREETLSAVLYSVIQNYLNRVVGNRAISKTRVMFQGATARNRGLIAAVENLLGVEVVVSPYCHIMGAWGVALSALNAVGANASKFCAFDLLEKSVNISYEPCSLCTNYCRISVVSFGGKSEKLSWGYQCGRDPEEQKPRELNTFTPFEIQHKLFLSSSATQPAGATKIIGIPRTLSMYSYYPLWREFFAQLGYIAKLTPYTDDEIKHRMNEVTGADFCFPVKAAHGHFSRAFENKNYRFIFVPYMISEKKRVETAVSYFCPYLESAPSLIRASYRSLGLELSRLLSPVIDFRRPAKEIAKVLFKEFGERLEKSEKEIRSAFEKAMELQGQYEESMKKEGAKILKEIEEKNETALVIIGRPYNIYDRGLNLNLPQKIAEHGFKVIPLEMLPLDLSALSKTEYHNMYWAYGQKIIAALKYISGNPHLYPVYFTNFNCGPDSFLLSYAEHEMEKAGKPMLTLELDEHGADGGYLTRVEAFIDVIRAESNKAAGKSDKKIQSKNATSYEIGSSQDDIKRRTIWIPPMHKVATMLCSAAFRGYGYKSEPLPPETVDDFQMGKNLTRGSECLPTSLTIGAFMNTLSKVGGKPGDHAFFMPTAEGPCRFGQYCRLDRLILDQHGYQDVVILSPSSINSYQGIEENLRRYLWQAFLAGDLLYKAANRIRPYERVKGETNEWLELAVKHLVGVFEKKANHQELLEEEFKKLNEIDTIRVRKPLVGVVGEIYVRSNDYANGDVVDAIERSGGEAWVAPLHEWIIYTTYVQSWMASRRKFNFIERGESLIKNLYFGESEHRYYKLAGKALLDRREPEMEEMLETAQEWLPMDFVGEAILTVGRSIMFAKQGASMVINCAPFGCMPGTITAGIFNSLQAELGIPILSQFYDGEGDLNTKIASYLTNIGDAGEKRIPVTDKRELELPVERA